MRYLVILFLLYAVHSFGQDKYQITGVVNDENNAPVPFANAALYLASDSSLVGGAVSDDAGRFAVLAAPGEYYMKVSFLSYNPEIIPGVKISGADIDLGTITLGAKTSLLREVEVTGQRSQMELQLDKRVFNVGQDLANSGGNAADILGNIPSVSVDVDGTVSLRGSENVRILIDGKPSGLTSRDPDALRQLQGNLVERVEVITNPSSRYDAEGEVGIINIVLKKNRENGLHGTFTAMAGYPEFYGGSYTINLRRKKINLFSSYGSDYRRSPGYSRSYQRFTGTDTSFVYTQDADRISSELSHNIIGGMDYFFNEKNTLTGSVQYNLDDGLNTSVLTYRDYLNDGLSRTMVRTDREQEDEYNLEGTLNYKREFSQKGREWVTDIKYIESLDGEESDFTQESSDGDNLLQRADNISKETNWLFQSDYIHPLGEDGKAEGGLKSSTRIIENDYALEELGDDGNWIVYPAFNNNMIYTERIHAAYLMAGTKIRKLSLQGGVRGEYSDITTELTETNERNDREYFNVFPSANLGYEIKKDRTFQLNYSYRINRPRFRDLLPFSAFTDPRNFFVGNPNLNPEYTHSFETGYLVNWQNGSFLSSVYYRARKGVIQRISEVDEEGINRIIPVNMATQNAYGVEMNFSAFVGNWWQINTSGNFYRAITEGNYAEERLFSDTYSFNSRTTSKMTLFKALTFQASFNYNSPEITTQGRERSRYSIDLGLSKDILKGKGTITANVRDLVNSRIQREIVDIENYYSTSERQWRPRTFRVTFTYRLNHMKERERQGDRDEENSEMED